MSKLTNKKQAPFAKIVQVVAYARTQLRGGASLNSVIRPVLQNLIAESRPTAQAIIYESVRKSALNAFIIQKLCRNKPTPAVQSLLEASLSALFLKRYSDFTIVSETVNAAKQHSSTRNASGFINAVLRRFLREQENLLSDASKKAEVIYNAPSWWINRITNACPNEAERVLSLGTQHPPMTLRVNIRKNTLQEYMQLLSTHGIKAEQVGRDAVKLDIPVAVEKIPGFLEGLCSVQDAGTQIAAHILQIPAGARVLDACSAPGGKTAHLLERYDCVMTALDIDEVRTEKIKETLSRLNLTAEIKTADAANTSRWWDGRPFDYILLDAPCTASGVVRRQPDTPWLRRAVDIKNLAIEQRILLKALWPLLNPGGQLLYATCSIFPEEGTDQIKRFLSETVDAKLIPIDGHDMLRLLPEEQSSYNGTSLIPSVHDGFFYALLEKER